MGPDRTTAIEAGGEDATPIEAGVDGTEVTA